MTKLLGFQGLLLILLAPCMIGVLRKLEAWLELRQGPGIFQPYRDIVKLMRKPAMRARTTSRLFAITPYVLFSVYGLLCLLAPVFHRATLASVDLIVVIYLLGMARFAFSLAGLDAGSSFGGLGSSRQMFVHLLTEIGLVLVIIALMVKWNTVSLTAIFDKHWELGYVNFLAEPELILLALSLALLILLESARIPIDNPATHLELTMSHKAIALEYAGRDLALIEWAEMIKLGFLLTLLGNLFLPFPRWADPMHSIGPSGLALAFGGYCAKLILLLLLLAFWELSQPKLRLRSIIGPSLVAIVLSLTAIIYTITLRK